MQVNTGNPLFTISSGNADANGFGNFEYAVPSGFFAMCTKNIGNYNGLYSNRRSIRVFSNCIVVILQMTTKTVTNDGNSDLQPDWLWIKSKK